MRLDLRTTLPCFDADDDGKLGIQVHVTSQGGLSNINQGNVPHTGQINHPRQDLHDFTLWPENEYRPKNGNERIWNIPLCMRVASDPRIEQPEAWAAGHLTVTLGWHEGGPSPYLRVEILVHDATWQNLHYSRHHRPIVAWPPRATEPEDGGADVWSMIAAVRRPGA